MPIYERRSPMPVSPAALFAYHSRPGALARLIPPWQDVRIVRSDDHIGVGARVTLEMKIGPLWKRWVAEHVDYVEGERFADRQVSGPFAAWTHTHAMLPGENEASSVLSDDVTYRIPLGFLGRAVGGAHVRREVERMFAFRHARTRFDVARHAQFADRARLRVAVSGAGGAIAGNLIPFLTTGGHAVSKLVRAGASPPRPDASANTVAWNPQTGAVDETQLAGCDALVHLAGSSIAVRWTEAHRREIVESRVHATRKLCETLARMPNRPRVLVCASAIGYYGDRGDAVLTEDSDPGSGFAADVCQQWEAATQPARDAGIRVVNLRIGVVLAARTGALAKLLTPAKLGLAGRVGDGRQWMSWIAMDDLIGVIHEALMNDWHGPINAVTSSTRQAAFIDTLGAVLRRPTVVPLPAAGVKAMFGQMGEEMLLASARVTSSRRDHAPLLPTLEGALRFELGLEGVTP